MKLSQYYKLRLPQRRIPEENDPADINDLTYNFVSLDSIAKNHADELTRLEADKATKAALIAHTDNMENPHATNKEQIGLSEVDNISSMNMPVSTAQQAAISLKADTSSVLTKENITEYTPTQEFHPATKKYVDDSVQAAGGGDMLKSVYDKNNDGIIDIAKSLKGGEW